MSILCFALIVFIIIQVVGGTYQILEFNDPKNYEDDVYRYSLYDVSDKLLQVQQYFQNYKSKNCIILKSPIVTLSKSVKNIVDVEKLDIQIDIKVIENFAAWKTATILVNNTSYQDDKTVRLKDLIVGDYSYKFSLPSPTSFDFKLTKSEELQIAYCGMTITVTNSASKPDCHYNCFDCKSNGVCAICQSGRDPKTCGCEANQSEQLFNPKCQPKPIRCPLECKQCIANTRQCQICDSSLFRQNNEQGQCACISGYYEDLSTSFTCKKCDTQCATCEKQSNNCLSCVDKNKQIDSTGICKCKESSYEKNNQCLPCIQGCISCSNDSSCNICNTQLNFQNKNNLCTCKDSYILNDKKDACICPKGFYENNGICQKCSEQCSECKSEKVCTSCSFSEAILTNLGTCVCKNQNEYFDLFKMKCSKCKDICMTCSEASTCDSCNNEKNFIFDPKSSQCICQKGYFALNNQCEKCYDLCNECTDFKVCTSCKYAGTTVIDNQINLSNSNCICQYGQYFDLTLKQCQICPAKCSKCFQNDQNIVSCTECLDPNSQFISEFDKSCKCQKGYYSDQTDSNKCKKCHDLCSNCESYDQCSSCKFPSLIIEKGKCQCKIGQFYDDQTNSCKNCQANCKSCLNQSSCLKCIDDEKYILDSSQQCSCKDGYYPVYQNDEGLKCIACDYMCSKCESKYKCTQCRYELTTLNSSMTTCQCSEGMTFDSASKQCQICPSGCSKCDSSKYCTECFQDNGEIIYKLQDGKCMCNDGYFLNTQYVCQKCSFICKTCENEHTCLSCAFTDMILKPLTPSIKTLDLFQDIQQKQQLCYCKEPNKFFKEKKCQKCMPSCGSCENEHQCLTCNDTIKYRFDEQTQQCKCSQGYYWSEKEVVCTDCTNKYILQNLCVDQCHPGLSVFNNRECIMECPAGYVSVNYICQPTFCNENCKICNIDRIHCDACNSHLYLMKDRFCRGCDEITQFYSPISRECLSCDEACSGCTNTSPSDCIECKYALSPYSRYQCVLECGELEYIKQHPRNPQQAICSICFRDEQNNTCSDKCNSGQYFDKQFTCKKCDTNCLECNGPSSKDCIKCRPGLFLLDNGECSRCGFGKYFDEGQADCKLCHYSCLTCNGHTNSDCVDCNYTLTKSVLTQKCLTSTEMLSEQKQIQIFQDYGCISNEYQECQNTIELAKQTSQYLKLGTSISSAFVCVTGLFFPQISFIAWQYVENHQVIGNLRDKYQLPFGISIHHLNLSKYFNIVSLFYDESDNDTSEKQLILHPIHEEDKKQPNISIKYSTEKQQKVESKHQQNLKNSENLIKKEDTSANISTISTLQNKENKFSTESENNIQQSQTVSDENVDISISRPKQKQKSSLFFKNCLPQLVILGLGLLLVILLFYIGSKNQIAQNIFLYLKWSFIIRIFSLFTNDFILQSRAFFSAGNFFDSYQNIVSLTVIVSTLIVYIAIHAQGFVFLFSIKQFCVQQKKQSFKILFENVKETSVMSRLYYYFFEIKKFMLIGFELIYEDSPIKEMIALISVTSIFILYVFFYKPIFQGRAFVIILVIEIFNLLFYTVMLLIHLNGDNNFYPQFLIHAFIMYEGVMIGCVVIFLIISLVYLCRNRRKKQIQENQNGSFTVIGQQINIEFEVVLEQQNPGSNFVKTQKATKIRLPLRKQQMCSSIEKFD